MFGFARKLCDSKKINYETPTIRITEKLLIDNHLNPGNLHYFLNKKVGYFVDETENIRNKVAHAIINENKPLNDFYNFDEMSDYSEICSIVNLADLLSYEVLKITFNYIKNIQDM